MSPLTARAEVRSKMADVDMYCMYKNASHIGSLMDTRLRPNPSTPLCLQ
jgi:hypothetical protein